MTAFVAQLPVGDTSPLLLDLQQATGGLLDLTGAQSVTVRIVPLLNGPQITRAAAITDRANGIVSLAWQAGDPNTVPGDYAVTATIVDGAGVITTVPSTREAPFYLRVISPGT